MKVKKILFEEFIIIFSDALKEADRKIEEKQLQQLEEVRQEHGEAISSLMKMNMLRLKNANLRITARPVIEKRQIDGKEVIKLYLAFGQPAKAQEFNITIDLE